MHRYYLKRKLEKQKQGNSNLKNAKRKNCMTLRGKYEHTSVTRGETTMNSDDTKNASFKSVNESNIESSEEENWNLSGVDQSATINMKKFHKSMEMSIIQCAVFKEAWPSKNETLKTKSETDYTCGRCKQDKIFPKKFSRQNNMVPSPVPSELQGLTQFEGMLITRAFPVIHVYTKPRGGQRAYKGHVITLPQDVQQLADILPRLPKDLPVIIFTVNGKNNESKDFQVRRYKVEAALHWLVKNNPVYKNVRIEPERIKTLPLDGNLNSKVTKIDFQLDTEQNISEHDDKLQDSQSKNSHCDSPKANGPVDIDRGPVNIECDEVIYNDETEMSSFLPLHQYTKKEKDIISTFPNVNEQKHSWKIDDNPLNEFNTEFLATMSFPSLFPDSIADPTSNITIRNISESQTESLAMKIKHLIRFGEKINGTWKYRFAAHPRFGYWAYNILYRKRLLSQGNFFIKQNPGEASLTLDELQTMLTSGTYSEIMSKLMHYAKNISGTNAYWNQVKQELRAIINQVGSPTIFWTLSCADFHWPEFHQLFSTDNLSNEQIRQNVINNPHILDWFFTERTESFVKWWLYKSLQASWHWFRYELAVQRGSVHCHGLAKLKDDPGLCELTKVALKGYLASKELEEK